MSRAARHEPTSSCSSRAGTTTATRATRSLTGPAPVDVEEHVGVAVRDPRLAEHRAHLGVHGDPVERDVGRRVAPVDEHELAPSASSRRTDRSVESSSEPVRKYPISESTTRS
ncbi:hypothetical protein [Janibacter melonis]|uniref:hypothetical protein n=1 Tax=Janibacter melonis TaxID=262209 RepID=UPI0020964304|nr:hypothetical protein [Janibacter melonis]